MYDKDLYIRMIELVADYSQLDVIFPTTGVIRGMAISEFDAMYEVQVIGDKAYLEGQYEAPLGSEDFCLAILEIVGRRGIDTAIKELVTLLVDSRHEVWEEYKHAHAYEGMAYPYEEIMDGFQEHIEGLLQKGESITLVEDPMPSVEVDCTPWFESLESLMNIRAQRREACSRKNK